MLFQCLILCYLLISAHSSTSIQSDYQIWDLEYNDDSCFSQDVASWSFSGPTIPSLINSYYDCGGHYIIGGINWSPSEALNLKYFSKTYTGLKPHSSIRYSIITYALDGWDYNNPAGWVKGDYIEVVFDTTSVELYVVDPFNTIGGGGYTTSYCGNANSDLTYTPVFGSVDHSGTSLTLKFVGHLSTLSTAESFGIREILLTFSTVTSPALATPCVDTTVTVYNMPKCTCAKGKYSGSSGCTDCDSSCDSCFGDGPTNCYVCKDGYYFDGTQCLACDSSCSRCSGPSNTECVECASGYKLFENICIPTSRCTGFGFALTSCSNQCTYPCSLTTRSTWGESCFPVCESPTSTILDFTGLCLSCSGLSAVLSSYDIKHASYVLTFTPSTCDLDISTINWKLQVTEKTTPSVLPTFTFVTSKTGTAQYKIDITFSSKITEESQLIFTHSYLTSTAKVPFDEEDSSSNAAELKEATKTTKAVVAGLVTGGLVGAMAAGATTVLWSIISFQQFVGYFLYINIKIPYHVEFFLSIVSSSLWDYLPNPLDNMTDEMYADLLDDNGQIPDQYQPPTKFQEYDVIPFFIKNGGALLVINLALLLILGLVLGLKKIEKLKKNKVLVFMKVALKWTIVARTFLENGIPLSLAIFLQFKIMHFDNLYLGFCSGLCIISAILVIVMTIHLTRILARRSNNHLEKPIIRRIYGTLYEGLQLKSTAKYYHIIILLRGVSFVGILVFLDASPVLQILYTIFCNVFLLYYMFKAAALEDFKLNIIARTKEILILAGEICMLLLYAEVDSEKYYDIVGWIMVGTLTSAVAIEVVYTLVTQIFNIKGTCNKVFKAFSFFMICFQKPKPKQRELRSRRLNIRGKPNMNLPSESTVIKMNDTTMINNSLETSSVYRR